MITGELKNKIDRLWETFWTGGITNPLDVVEQMTYLMFIHDLDAADNQRARERAMLCLPHQSIFAGEVQVGERTILGNQLKWSVFHDFPAGQMYSVMQSRACGSQQIRRDVPEYISYSKTVHPSGRSYRCRAVPPYRR